MELPRMKSIKQTIYQSRIGYGVSKTQRRKLKEKVKTMTKDPICPECMKNGIYLSKANIYVCKNCGTIYHVLSSAQHLAMAREIKILQLEAIKWKKNKIIT